MVQASYRQDATNSSGDTCCQAAAVSGARCTLEGPTVLAYRRFGKMESAVRQVEAITAEERFAELVLKPVVRLSVLRSYFLPIISIE